jgi:hypothetical protein
MSRTPCTPPFCTTWSTEAGASSGERRTLLPPSLHRASTPARRPCRATFPSCPPPLCLSMAALGRRQMHRLYAAAAASHEVERCAAHQVSGCFSGQQVGQCVLLYEECNIFDVEMIHLTSSVCTPTRCVPVMNADHACPVDGWWAMCYKGSLWWVRACFAFGSSHAFLFFLLVLCWCQVRSGVQLGSGVCTAVGSHALGGSVLAVVVPSHSKRIWHHICHLALCQLMVGLFCHWPLPDGGRNLPYCRNVRCEDAVGGSPLRSPVFYRVGITSCRLAVWAGSCRA